MGMILFDRGRFDKSMESIDYRVSVYPMAFRRNLLLVLVTALPLALA
jgi:hypothetical protein